MLSLHFKPQNFYMPSIFLFKLHCDTILSPRRHIVADPCPCRHNFTQKTAKYFPISQNRRTFASSKGQLINSINIKN